MNYSELVKDHMSRITISDTYLIETNFSLNDLYSICNAPKHDIVKYAMRKKMTQRTILTKKSKKRAVSALVLPKLIDNSVTYQEYLDRVGYKPPNLANIY